MTLPPARLVLPALAAALVAPVAPAPAAGPAGDPQAQSPQARPPRPAPANARVEKLSPGLEATLAAWHAATDGVTTLEGAHAETQVIHSAGQETHREGRFFYEEPDSGRIDLRPADVAGKAGKAHRGAEPYAVVAGPAETWVCDGERVIQLDQPAKEARVNDLPPDQRGANIINGPLPFLLGVPPRDAQGAVPDPVLPADEAGRRRAGVAEDPLDSPAT